MKTLVNILLILLATNALVSGDRVEKEYKNMFRDFVERYNKTYENHNDFTDRYSIFKDNVRMIDNHNAGKNSWKMSVNHFADLSYDEFAKNYIGRTKIRTRKSEARNFPENSRKLFYSCDDMGFCSHYIQKFDTSSLPTTWDWNSQGKVTPIKNQGQCGSCWAFSTTGSLESAYAISKNKLYSLSEQELMDCSHSFGNQGCEGGLMDDAFMFVKSNGICKENTYPYKAVDEKCRESSCSSLFKISGYTDVPTSDENALQLAVYKQPVSVAIEADQPGFQFYSRGVFNTNCGYKLDHGVLAVGWGTEGGLKYWRVKNSWGSAWGDNGYILLARNTTDKRGQCGIAMQPSYPNI